MNFIPETSEKENITKTNIKKLAEHHLNTAKLQGLYSGGRNMAHNEFRVSSAYKCPRELFFERALGKRDDEIDFENIESNFLPGTAAHFYFQWWDKNNRTKDEKSVVYEDNDITIKGHVDNLTVHNDTVLDYKTVGYWGFNKYFKPEIQNHHFIQASMYDYLLQPQRHWVAIARISKENYKHHVNVEKANFEEVKRRINNFKEISHQVLSYQLDKDLYFHAKALGMETCTNWGCKYCKYKTECKATEEYEE